MELTAGELITEIRAKRDALLKESDYTQLPDSPFSNEEKMAWVVYLRRPPLNRQVKHKDYFDLLMIA